MSNPITRKAMLDKLAAAGYTREERVAKAKAQIYTGLNYRQQEFLNFVLAKYIETGVDELDQEKLPDLLTLKYHATTQLGGVQDIRDTFINFQKYLYLH